MVINYKGESYIIPNNFIEEVRADERKKAEQDFQNSDYWNDYLSKVIAFTKTHERENAIEDCKEVVRRLWIEGTILPTIAQKIYGDLEKLKEEK